MPEHSFPTLDLERINELRTYYPSQMAFSDTMDEFLEDADVRLAQMRRALSTNRLEVIQEHAHALKGSSEFVGAQQLAWFCQTIQKEAGQTDESTIQALEVELQRFKNRFAHVIKG